MNMSPSKNDRRALAFASAALWLGVLLSAGDSPQEQDPSSPKRAVGTEPTSPADYASARPVGGADNPCRCSLRIEPD